MSLAASRIIRGWPFVLGIALGHVPGALLVTHEDVADGRVDDGVVHGQDGAARQAEEDLDLLHLQALDEGLGSRQLHRCSFVMCQKMKRPPGWEVVGACVVVRSGRALDQDYEDSTTGHCLPYW